MWGKGGSCQGGGHTPHKTMMRISSHLKDLMPKMIMNKTSAPVISTPAQTGIWKSRFMATADPMTSAKSVAAIATSAINQRTYTTYTVECH